MEAKVDKRQTVLAKTIRWLLSGWRFVGLSIVFLLLYKFIVADARVGWLLGSVHVVVVAFVLAYFLDPLVRRIEKYFHLKRTWSVVLTYGLIIFVGYLFVKSALPSIWESILLLIQNGPGYLNEINRIVIENRFNLSPNILEFIQVQLDGWNANAGGMLGDAFGVILNGAFKVTSVFVKFTISMFIAFYILTGLKGGARKARLMAFGLLPRDVAERVVHAAALADRSFKGFFIGKLFDSLIIGAIFLITVTILSGFENIQFLYIPLMALIIAITNMIPYFGPWIGGIPCIIISLFAGLHEGAAMTLVILAIQQFDGLILGPKILGDVMGITPFWVLSSITVGGALFGPLGMLIAVPTAVVIIELFTEYVNRQLEKKGIDDQIDMPPGPQKGKNMMKRKKQDGISIQITRSNEETDRDQNQDL
ncbi:AI-2E family transporter [Gottschalkiaceae bacterium SANA]|nr:AI-2E family transporter [Gottschalkiaceae bacterium SANA]